MLLTDVIEENLLNSLFICKQSNDQNNIVYDDNLLPPFTMDSELMLENDLDLLMLEPDLTTQELSQSYLDIKSSPSSTYSNDYYLEQTELNNEYNSFINPDDFLNDVKTEISSPNRNTPSPSSSSGNSEYSGYSSSSNTILIDSNNIQYIPKTVCKAENYINIVDTPPISPSSVTNISFNSTQSRSPPPFIINPTQTAGLKFVQGTIIPIQALPLSHTELPLTHYKKLKIQPKPENPLNCINKNNGGNVGKLNNKKTIILSAKEFSALVNNVNNTNGTNIEAKSIILKTTNQIKRTIPMVLPKKNQQSNNCLTSTSNVNQCQPAPGSIKGINNDVNQRAIKKQQRMIKNRESACLSRKKKKEYVTSLEQEINKLQKENIELKYENTALRDSLIQAESKVCKCKTSNSCFPISSKPAIKKSTAFLLAMVFMVSLNFGPFGKYFISSSNLHSEATDKDFLVSPVVYHSRGLLWIDDKDYSDNKSVSFYDNETEISGNRNSSNMYPICPMFINQTESIRLASELRRWIGEPNYFNLSINSKIENEFDINSISDLFLTKRRSLQNKTKKRIKKAKSKRFGQSKEKNEVLPYHRRARANVQIFQPTENAIKYAEFFEEIRRRDDTFYVVSFSGDHLLLPALAHNKTLRPKMSLMLPTVDINDSFSNEYVTLMQIDCEVVNTSILRVREKLIPDNLRQNNTNNENANDDGRKTGVRNNKTVSNVFDNNPTLNISKQFMKNYKPYLIDKNVDLKKIYGSANNIKFEP